LLSLFSQQRKLTPRARGQIIMPNQNISSLSGVVDESGCFFKS
jgi:hypothetical protein